MSEALRGQLMAIKSFRGDQSDERNMRAGERKIEKERKIERERERKMNGQDSRNSRRLSPFGIYWTAESNS